MIDRHMRQPGPDPELAGADVADSISSTLSQAFAVIDACACDETVRTAKELARRVELPVTKVVMLLTELERSGFVTRANGSFRLGQALVGVGWTGDHSTPRPGSAASAPPR